MDQQVDQKVIGVDLGATNVRIGVLQGDRLTTIQSERINAQASEEEVLQQLIRLIDSCSPGDCAGIGVGAPSVVDAENGIIYDTINIPSWKEVHLGRILETRYRIPAYVNNDANCFALGEKYFGQGRDYHNLVALTVGTGLGAGIIIDDRLYSGRHGGAGEFGMVPYRDRCLEYYASGQFFSNVYGVPGDRVAAQAALGETRALEMFNEFGGHFGNAIQTILYALDPEIIILGGSVSRSFRYFEAALREKLKEFVYPRTVSRLKLTVSRLHQAGLLGAAALCYDARRA